MIETVVLMPSYPDITVDITNDRFFIAICKKDLHSFVAFGVMKNDKPIMLARVGGGLCHKRFKSEPLYFPGRISYTAYSIRYEQYLQFIQLLKISSKPLKVQYRCYTPVSDVEVAADSIRTLKCEYIFCRRSAKGISVESKEAKIITNANHITPFNTCRHTAIDLIEYTQGTNEATPHVSRFFFYDLLLKNKVDSNHIFYILPAPPGAHTVGPETKAILTKIYTRMHALLKKDPDGKSTLAKFNALEKLYKQQAGSPTDNLDAMLSSIQDWKKEHLDVIKPLRQQGMIGKCLGFFKITYKSSTEAMADEMESSLEKKGSSGIPVVCPNLIHAKPSIAIQIQ